MKIGKYDFEVKWFEKGMVDDRSVDWQLFLREFAKISKPGYRVLEIGASTKTRTAALAKMCMELTGLELLPEKKPADFDNAKFITGNWEKLSDIFKPESFDMIVSSHVLEHVQNDSIAMKEMYRTLKKGGAAIMTTPNLNRTAALIESVFKGKKVFPWFEHIREYDEQSLIALAKSAGFEKIEILPVAFGIAGWKLFLYMHPVPGVFRKYCCFWMVKLYK